jgi:replicative DNA helicase Mcm
LRAIIRITEAIARMRLSDRAVKFDAEQAVAIMKFSLEEIATDPVTGQLDIDRIVGDTPFSVRKASSLVRDLCHELSETNHIFSEQELIDACKAKGIERSLVLDVVEKLRREGEIFEPKPGMLRILT